MRKTAFSLILIAATFTACSSQAPTVEAIPVQIMTQPEIAAPSITPNLPAPAISQAPAVPAPATQDPSPTTNDQQAGSPITYQIVPGESQVIYQVGEVFIDQNNRFNEAIGVTSQVNGEVLADFQNPQASSIGPIEVDISQFTSDSRRRDNAIRGRYLESARYPIARFIPQEIIGLPEGYTEGETVAFQVRGDLTIREVTRPAEFDVTLTAGPVSLQGEAVTSILMSDYGFGPISIGGILNTEDEVRVTFEFLARPSQ